MLNKCTKNALHTNCTPESTQKLRILPVNDKTASTDLKSFLSYVSSKKRFFERARDINFGNLTKSFKTVQTQNYSYCMSNNWGVIFVKMLHVFHSFIVPCFFSDAWPSSATTGPYPAWLNFIFWKNFMVFAFSVY